MKNQELLMAGNHEISFRQEQYMEARQNTELFTTHDYNFALEPLHETNLQIGVSREQNEVWNHNQEHALTLQNSRTHSEEQDLEGKDEVDSQENQNESYDHTFDLSFPDNDDSETSENDKLALIVSQDLNDNLQLAVGHCMNRDPIPGVNISLSQQLELAPPIIQCRSLQTAPEHNLVVGMEFSDVLACRRALRDAAIALRFEMQTVKSDKTRFTAKCNSEGCPWRIHCAKLPGVPTFTIRTIHGSHTCGGISHLGHHQASVQWVAEAVTERLKVNPHCKPKEILEEIHQVHGITLSYKQAWRGKERIMAAVRGSYEEDYRLLPRYCDQIKRTNPGSVAVVHGSPVDGSFQQLFISFQASIGGFLNACRPLIGLDRTVLKSKYVGTLLLATGFDGDGAVFPLAFALISEENDSSWQWFLSELRQLLEVNSENMPKLTILSSRDQSIVDGVDTNFPTAFHGLCVHGLTESFRSQFNNSILVNLFWEAAKCLTDYEFEGKIEEIEQISPEAALWIRNSQHSRWATYCFEGTRFGHLTANVSESLNSWIQDASGLPIIQMMESIRRQLMTLFNERRETSMQWSTMLVPSAERHVLEAIEESHLYQVHKANEAQFEVMTSEAKWIVDIRCRSCQCRGWELYGLPCSHAVAALFFCRQNVYRFTESYFTVANYRRTYSETIHPVPDKTEWKTTEPDKESGKDGEEIVIRPPSVLRQPPRPRKRRSQGEDRGRQKRVVRCSRCNQAGHFRTTCTAPT
ncbi:Zinc finger SWIM-type [Arabidopsis thaliana x Arabidopsis arenosa]|uniref:Zinc finger SWIM-type n=1 Tax=Arabidopsis thaliana x Arabidopsis arenosa TaxID=1240361 RepID=A0A8T2A865_9BRAS|nr:Zinc finger SWIM-type [Arabidopsis thaliana x Arabidopsis arenosa]